MAIKYFLVVTCSFVSCYLLLLVPLIFPLIDDVPFRNHGRWWTKPTVLSSPISIKEATTRRPRTALEQKFAIHGPHVQWDMNVNVNVNDTILDVPVITLDYEMSDWVTENVLQFKFYDFDCQNVLEDWELGWKGYIVQTVSQIETNDSSMEQAVWRLCLQANKSNHDDDDKVMDKDMKVAQSFCVRWMLFNLPMTNEHAMEVTFRQTQLVVEFKDEKLWTVQVSSPEPIGIQVHVNGQGRAIVHGEEEAATTTTVTNEL